MGVLHPCQERGELVVSGTVIAVMFAIVAVIILLVVGWLLYRMRVEQRMDSLELYKYIDAKTSGMWSMDQAKMQALFDELHRRLLKDIQSRVSKEIDDIREVMKARRNGLTDEA